MQMAIANVVEGALDAASRASLELRKPCPLVETGAVST